MGLENVYKKCISNPFGISIYNSKKTNLVIIFKTKIIVLLVSRTNELRNILLRHILSDITFRRQHYPFGNNFIYIRLFVFYVLTPARSFRDGTPIYCSLRRTWSSVNTPFLP